MMKYYIEKSKGHDLLKKVLKEDYRIDNYELEYNECGKPFLKNSNLFFSLSHSNLYSALVVSDREVGIDIEKIIYVDSIFKRYFNDEEKDFVNKSINRDKAFTEIWTRKEAYLKRIGIGLNPNLKEVNGLDRSIVSYVHNDLIVSISKL